MRLSIIVAVADNGIIGSGDGLPWRLSADLKRFKSLTMGHHLLMGRKTFDSIGTALPGRQTVVISRGQPTLPAGVLLANSLEEAVELARSNGDEEAFVAGGAQIYAQALPVADRIFLTRVHARPEGDTLFPTWEESQWREVSREDHGADYRNEYDYSFHLFERD